MRNTKTDIALKFDNLDEDYDVRVYEPQSADARTENLKIWEPHSIVTPLKIWMPKIAMS